MAMIRDPVLGILVVSFVILGAIAAFYLVQGWREQRYPRRLTYPFLPRPVSTERDPDYAYRHHSGSLFWVEAWVQLSAVLACVISLYILLSAL